MKDKGNVQEKFKKMGILANCFEMSFQNPCLFGRVGFTLESRRLYA